VSTFDAGSDLPEILAPVSLQVGTSEGLSVEMPSRVCDVERVDDAVGIVVARPDLTVVTESGIYPREGGKVMLNWPRPKGVMQWSVVAEAALRPYGPVWILTPEGAPTLEQRRQFFRTEVMLPVMLTPVAEADEADEAEDAGVEALMVDISEGGAAIACQSGLPEPGTVVSVSFTLDETTVTLDAEVLRHKKLATGQMGAALRFVDPASYGDDIRRFAFAMQRSQVRTRLD